MITPTNDRQTSEREQIARDLIEHWPDDIECLAAAKILRADEAEIAQLRENIEQARRAADYWKAEHLTGNNIIDKLRAENEALRTVAEGKLQVTDEDMERVMEAFRSAFHSAPNTTHGRRAGRTYPAIRAALQSFVRSKEKRATK